MGAFVEYQDLRTWLSCHREALAHPGGVLREILYDRMKTAVLGELERHVVYNAKMIAFPEHDGSRPCACKAHRAKTKGKFVHTAISGRISPLHAVSKVSAT